MINAQTSLANIKVYFRKEGVVKKTMLLFVIILCLCSGGVSFANGGSAAERYYPDTVWQVTDMGKILEVTDAEAIKALFDGVKENRCTLNIMGAKDALPEKIPSIKNNFTLAKKPDPRAVFIIGCSGSPGGLCYPSPTGWKCCPPCCPPTCR